MSERRSDEWPPSVPEGGDRETEPVDPARGRLAGLPARERDVIRLTGLHAAEREDQREEEEGEGGTGSREG